jgi:hypothetical protein
MRSIIAPLCVLLVVAVSAGAARAADPPDDAAALQLADQAPSPPPAAKKYRAYVEAAAARNALAGSAGSTNATRGSLDLRYDATVGSGLRVVLSDRLDLVHNDTSNGPPPRQRNVNALREAYASWQARPDAIVDIGRVNVRHGAAWGYNPTDFFKGGTLRSIVSPDPASLRENRLGTVVVQGQKLWSRSSLTGAFSPRLASTPSDASYSLDLGATNARNRWLLAGSHKFGEQLNPELLLFGGAGTPTQAGLNLSGLLGSATVAYLEASAGKGRSLVAQSQGTADPERWQRRAALGLTYTTAFNLSLTAEADYNSAAPNRAQWDALRSGAPTNALRLLQTAQGQQELPVRRGAFFYATWRDALVKRLDLSAFVRHDAVTDSRVQWLETRYHWDRIELALQCQLYSGGAGSVFGSVPQRRSVEASLRMFL